MAVPAFHCAASDGQTLLLRGGIIQLVLPIFQVAGQPVQGMLPTGSGLAAAFRHHSGHAPRIDAPGLLPYPGLGGFRIAFRQGGRTLMPVFQEMVAVQQVALPGKDRRHLLGNPGGAISHPMHPGVVPIPAPQR